MLKIKFLDYFYYLRFFSILSKIITVSESTLLYRKRLRTIYRDYLNEQRTVKHIQYGRMK